LDRAFQGVTMGLRPTKGDEDESGAEFAGAGRYSLAGLLSPRLRNLLRKF
jgi:hypothetical protein